MSLLRTNKEFAEVYDRHFETVYRVCFTYMKNASDTEDLVHDTFCKLIETQPKFKNLTHEKAWLICTAGNLCKNKLKHWWRRREDIDNCGALSDGQMPQTNEVLDAILSLPPKYKTMVYLFYYEGYSGEEIAAMLHIPSASVRVYLHRARDILKKQLGGDFYEE